MPQFKKTTTKTLSAHLRAFADTLDEFGGPDPSLAKWFNEKMDELLGEDFFGTEGQCDPRGDHRD